ncbi:MAG: uracil-DNA glycosylase [Candidatus Nanopelagicales bacterium]
MADLADGAARLADLEREIVECRACPRLVAWREQVGRERRAAYSEQEYWARPVPGFGDPAARVVVVGLAPAAHGGNRTGRMFTGDRSGEWLYRAMFRAGLANQPTAVNRDDGLRLSGAWVTAPVRCAPPENKPTLVERDTCAPFLWRELGLLAYARVYVALGAFAWASLVRRHGIRAAPKFGHGTQVELHSGLWLLGCYHVSQQNTFTGRLTEPMLDDVFARAVALASCGATTAGSFRPGRPPDRSG